MPRISINEMTTYHWSFEEDVSQYQQAGIGGIGVWRRKLEEFGEERGVEMLRESGLAVTSLSCAGGFTGSDGHTFCDAVDDALEALRLAAEMHASCLVVVTGSRAGHTLNHAGRLACDALRELGDAGAALGVEIAVAPWRRSGCERWTFLGTLSAMVQLLERCDHPRVGMLLDVAQLCRRSTDSRTLADVVPWVKIAGLTEECLRVAADIQPAQRVEAPPSPDAVVRDLDSMGFRGTFEAQVLCEKSWKSDYVGLIADCRQRLEALCLRQTADRSAPAFAGPTPEQSGALRVAVEPARPE